MSKRWKIRCTVLFGLTFVYLVWVSHPTIRDPEQLQALLQKRQQIFDLQQRLYAADVAENTYLDPTFRAAWATRSEQKDSVAEPAPGSPSETLHDFNAFNPVNTNGQFTIKQMDKISESIHRPLSSFEAARARLKALLPSLEQALSKPVFLTPSAHFDVAMPVCNYIAVRQVAQVLDFEASLEANEGQPDEAAEKALLGLRLGHNLATGPGGLINLGISIAIQFIDFKALHEIMLEHALKPATLERIIAELDRDILPADAVASAVENRMAPVHNSVRPGFGILIPHDASDHTFNASPLVYLLKYTGLASREMRMYDNDMLGLLPAAYGTPVDFEWLRLEGTDLLWSDLRGSHAYISNQLISPFSLEHFQLKLARAKLAGLRILASAQLYRARKGEYASSLEQLAPVPANDPSDKPIQYTVKDGKPRVLVPVSAPAGLDTRGYGERGYTYQDEVLNLTP